MGIEGNSPTPLVQVTVQADWTDVVAEALRLNSTGSFWVSCYKRGTMRKEELLGDLDEKRIHILFGKKTPQLI